MIEKVRNIDWAKVLFMCGIAFALFLTGGVFATKQLQPYQMFEDGFKAAEELVVQELRTRHELIQPIRYAGDGVLRHDAGAAYSGLTLVETLFPHGAEIQLIDMDGRLVNRWPVSFFDIWPDPTHIPPETIPATHLNYHTQGMWLLPDGSVVFNVANYGTVKMDKCGSVLWTVDRAMHHSITPNPDGSFWILARSDPDAIPDELKLTGVDDSWTDERLVRYEDLLLKIDANGQVLEEISLLKAFFEGEFNYVLHDARLIDPTHANDIEVVTAALADRLEGVDEGDLLVSVREFHMLVILDQVSGDIKWHQIGPWVRQHDPEITENGIIEVFDNGGEHRPPDQFKGSRIVALDPVTRETQTLYPRPGDETFFSVIMGTHQRLPNGNRLITETTAGRLFEVTSDGRVVWEYVKPYDDTHAGYFPSAIRYAADYFNVTDWSCPATAVAASD